ncbi:MAG: D-alanyl-D-alanine carboxypeptidase/D-alanyl-D-alanine-endopeptidase, partial [Lentisphaerae bacterium]|nr:D-alanyl-D-alanine carboxypeptidase/D-alanyl-D-alanine-endopeptidase [Lentisphaerota bacterium]
SKLAQSIDTLIDKNLPNAFVGVIVKDINNNVYYQQNANKHFIPASSAKLFTSTAAILNLGKNFKYITEFRLYKTLITGKVLNGNLYIKFTGDPSYARKNLHQNLMNLKKYGIDKIRGNIVLDNTNYSGLYYAPGISYDDLGCSYAAPVSSIMLDSNLLHVNIKGADEVGSSAKILPNRQTAYFKIDNKVLTVEKKREGDSSSNISIYNDNDDNIKLTGSISNNYREEKTVAIVKPIKYVRAVIKRELRQCNIKFNKKIIIGTTPSNTAPVVSHASLADYAAI